MHHLLIVDDDVKIRQLLKNFLINNFFIVSTASNVAECLKLFQYFSFDAIILDIMMPDVSGLEFLEKYRKTVNCPILLLSALGDVDDRIQGLEKGANDYMSKPFEPRELILRITNMLSSKSTSGVKNICEFGDFKFNIKSLALLKKGEEIKLTLSEKELMKFFAMNSGKVISRDDLIKEFQGINERSIDTKIARLRSKIEEDSKNPKYLQTIRSGGYTLYAELK